MGALASPELVVDVARAADAAGFDGLWLADHLIVPRDVSSEHFVPSEPFATPFEQMRATMGLNLELNATLAAVAAVTSDVKLCTGVAVLPIRNPLANAHQLATIDLISGGRLVYGVGVGWLEEEADALGMPWNQRGKRSDEIIALLRTLWTATGETVEFHGRFYDVPPIAVEPLPVQRPIPILVGGSSRAALDRVARLGDGWISTGLELDRVPRLYERLQRACEGHRRDISELAVINGETADVLLDAADADVVAQAERSLEVLAAYEELGVTHMKVALRATSAAGLLELVDVCARELVPAWRRR